MTESEEDQLRKRSETLSAEMASSTRNKPRVNGGRLMRGIMWSYRRAPVRLPWWMCVEIVEDLRRRQNSAEPRDVRLQGPLARTQRRSPAPSRWLQVVRAIDRNSTAASSISLPKTHYLRGHIARFRPPHRQLHNRRQGLELFPARTGTQRRCASRSTANNTP